MRNHRIVLWVSILLDVQILLNLRSRVGKESPSCTDRCAKFLERVVVVGGDGDDLCVCHGDLRVESSELQMLLVFLLGSSDRARA